MWGEEFNFSGDELPVKDSIDPMVTTPTPDGNLNYNDLVGSTLKVPYFPQNILAYLYICYLKKDSFNFHCGTLEKILFQKLYPDDEFFPETINTDSSDKLDDESDLLES
ncbi:hypothetical protein Tco_1097519 [Tanacetum coccineum]